MRIRKFHILMIAYLIGCSTAMAQKSGNESRIEKEIAETPFSFSLQLGIGEPIEISRDGKFLLSNSNGLLKLVDIMNGRELKTYKNKNHLFGAGFSPDGNYIINLASSPELISTLSGEVIQTYETKASTVFDYAFSSDGNYLALTADGDVLLWDLINGKKIRDFKGSDSTKIVNVAFGPNDKYVISWSIDWVLRVWDIISGREVNVIQFWNSTSFSITKKPSMFDRENIDFSSDGHLMVYAPSSPWERFPHKIELWDIIKGKKVNTFNYLSKDISDVFITPDDKFVVVRNQNSIQFIEILNRQLNRATFCYGFMADLAVGRSFARRHCRAKD